MKARACVIVFGVLYLLRIEIGANSHKCHFNCRHMKHHRLQCPSLNSEFCEIVPCGCCKQTCAVNLDQRCSSRTPRCATGLMCVNSKGEALKVVPHHMKHFVGVCQNVYLSPLVVENTNIQERRVRI